MRKSRIAIITVAMLTLMIAASIQIHASAPETLIKQAETELIENLHILDNVKWTADSASVESITAQLNEALKLLEEAKQRASEGRISEANTSAEQALSLIKKAKSEAEFTLEASTQRTLQIQVFSWALVPVASFLTALVTTRGYEWYVKRERRKLLGMTITRKNKRIRSRDA